MKKNNTPQDKRLLKRKRAESRLKAYGIVSICLALIMLITLMTSIGLNGYSALQQAYVKLDVKVESLNVLDEDGFFSKKKALLFNWDGVVRNSFLSNFPDVTKRSEKRALRSLISTNAGYDLRQYFETLEKPPLEDIALVLESGEFAAESKSALEFYSQFSHEIPPDRRENPCEIWPDHSGRNLLLKESVAAMDDANLDASLISLVE